STAATLSIYATRDSTRYDVIPYTTLFRSYSPSPLYGTDTVTGLAQAFVSKNVLGTNGSTLHITAYTVNDGNSGNNYSVTAHTASGTITAATVTASIVGNPTKTYDGTTNATLTSANFSLSAVISGESFTVTQTS